MISICKSFVNYEEIATELEVNFTLQVKLRVLLAQEGLIRRLQFLRVLVQPGRKLSKLNSNKEDTFGVPVQIFSPSHLSPSERKDLEQSDILSCSNGTNRPQIETFRKSSVMTSGPGKKVNPTGQARCETLLKRLMSHQYGWIFNSPVDIVKLNIPDYYTIIKNPMDLGTVKSKISSGAYSSPSEFMADVRLTFKNAMVYNPQGSDAYIMADTLNNFFEMRWKSIEKKLPRAGGEVLQENSEPHEYFETAETSPAKKRKVSSFQHDIMPEPGKRGMTDEERFNLGRELESLLGEMPVNIIDFLREHCSSGKNGGEEEIEIDIDELSDGTLSTLRKLLDDYLQEKRKNQTRGEPCEIELLNESGPSNSSMHQQKGYFLLHFGMTLGDEDIDIGGNEPPVSSYQPVEIEKEKDSGHKNSKTSSDSSSDSDCSSQSESDIAKASSPTNVPRVSETLVCGARLGNKTNAVAQIKRNQSVSGLDQLEQTSQEKLSSVESDCQQDGEYKRIGLFLFVDKGDPQKLQREMEELELHKKKEKARLLAEAKAAEDAQRQAEAAAAAEARQKRELEREAARQALLKMEKTVDINENSQFLEDLEMLSVVPAEHVPSSVDETSPDPSQDGLGGFKFGACNPLERLGLFMKDDDEEEEGEQLNGMERLIRCTASAQENKDLCCQAAERKKCCWDFVAEGDGIAFGRLCFEANGVMSMDRGLLVSLMLSSSGQNFSLLTIWRSSLEFLAPGPVK
ncbi:GLOBAL TRANSCRIPTION FACTOR GROUP E8-RELATED [Salix purpurea]|uniref:GLOBAL TRANSCRIPTION FACTOR GROUP E8-RELATED n=1 Tax=Salix purpurea TaxID=77065 RepID=A0A9Q0VSY1_SALPP|nr:GLOBAL TRANSCRIPTION FACTOR GROUP E8-RELATED [Salix purpurea]